jgi:hypothetical protein
VVEDFQVADSETNEEASRGGQSIWLNIYRFRFEWHIRAMIQRTFVNFCRGFEFSLDQNEWQAAFLTVDKRGARSFDNFGKQVLCAVTARAFVNLYLGFKLSLDHE